MEKYLQKLKFHKNVLMLSYFQLTIRDLTQPILVDHYLFLNNLYNVSVMQTSNEIL